MINIIIKRSIILILLIIVLVSCDTDNNSTLVKVTFFNYTPYDVDIFYNFNPQSSDLTSANSYIGTADQVSRKLDVLVPVSSDLLLGDTFYLRYRILLQDSYEVINTGLYVHAERTMHNIQIVIKNGQSYIEIIEEPPVNELRFVNGIIKVQNVTTGQLWVENHGVILPQKGRDSALLTLGQIGFFELTLPFLAESWLMNFLQSRDSHGNRTSFPAFEMERGKIYSFKIDDTGISGPEVTNINYLAL
ncbi:MAG: hypothetical protein FWD13_07005 [Treponema sp.]|nr:hypothetical protein [Treponema sp.]